ncbi:MAG: protein-disulfide reductase DsbD family protein [Myxococcota bacterium]
MRGFPSLLQALAVALVASAWITTAQAAIGPSAEGAVENGEPGVRATLLVDAEAGRAGVWFELADGWHLYWRNPGDSGLAPEIEFAADGGASEFGEIAWPVPRAFREDVDIRTYGYEGRVLLAAPMRLAADARSVRARVDVLVCADQCVPADLELRRALGTTPPELVARFEESALRVPSPARDRGVEVALEWPAAPDPGGRLEAALRVTPCPNGSANANTGAPCGWSAPATARGAFFPYGLEHAAALHAVAVEPRGDGGWRVALRGEAWESLSPDAVLRGVVTLVDEAGVARGLEVALPLAGAAPLGEARPVRAGVGAAALLRALLFGLIGGLLLNLMPCVLPVLAIKVFAVAELGRQGRREIVHHALAYTLGILVTLSVFALVVVALRWSGTAVGWGFHLQEPLFVAVVAAVVVVFAMNLLGAFEFTLGQRAMAVSNLGAGAVGSRRSFFDGLLAVILATPCSAPFLGTAIGFAFASPAPVILAIFLSIGLGLASPFLAVAAVPGAARFVPRSGPWMVELRRGLGFALIATALWLVWIVGRSAGTDAMTALLFLLLAAAFLTWTFGLVQKRRGAPGLLLVAGVAGLLALGLGQVELTPAPDRADPGSPADGAPAAYSRAALEGALAAGRPVFVYYTADWCLTCKVNESRVLSDPQVGDVLAREGFEVLRADWTRRDESIRLELAKLGKAGVPVYALYTPGRPEAPRLLPEILGLEAFLNALAETAEETRRVAAR